ncbi:MAG: DDE-type integrase/transposase/recombinase [Pseudomonas marincola]
MTNPFRYFKTSPEIIRLAVMMYVRYPLSLRQGEDLLHERGIDVSYETVRAWWNRFGPLFAAEIKKTRSASMRIGSQWRWHLGEVLEAFVTKRRDRKAALKFLKKTMKKYDSPKVIVADRLRSYRAAMKIFGNESRQETRQWLNNRAENSHQPFRQRERAMIKFRSTKSLQKFVSIHSSVHNHFNLERHLTSRQQFKLNREAALADWRQLAA